MKLKMTCQKVHLLQYALPINFLKRLPTNDDEI